MTKFHKIQKISSIIPFYSTYVILFITMFQLKKHKASFKLWLLFHLNFFISGLLLFILNSVIMTGQHLILNYIASGLLLAITNFVCVELQIKSTEEKNVSSNGYLIMNIVTWILVIGVSFVGVLIAYYS